MNASVIGDVMVHDSAIVGEGVVLDGSNGMVEIREGAIVRHGAVVLGPCVIGEWSDIGWNVVVTTTIPPRAILRLDRSRLEISFASSRSKFKQFDESRTSEGGDVGVRSFAGEVRIIDLPTFSDIRGQLHVFDLASNELEFPIRRMFWVDSVPRGEPRGEHAHVACWQALQSVRGSLDVLVDDGRSSATIHLGEPSQLLVIPPLIWATQFGHSSDNVLAVYCSHGYDESDYLRTYEDFVNAL